MKLSSSRIKKAEAKLAVSVFVFIIVGQALIQSQINFVGGVYFFVFDDGHFVFKMAKIASAGLVNQGVSIGQKEDALFHATFPQAMDDLKSGVGFARAGGHSEQNAVLPFGNGLNSLGLMTHPN